MGILSYQIACKSCMKMDEVKRILMIDDLSVVFHDDILKSEYEIAHIIRNNLIRQKKGCPICGFYNLEIGEIEFNQKKISIKKGTVYYSLTLDKQLDGNVKIEPNGSYFCPIEFQREAYEIIENIVYSTPDGEFEEKEIGTIKFVVSRVLGRNRLERFLFMGFSKEHLTEILRNVKNDILVDLSE